MSFKVFSSINKLHKQLFKFLFLVYSSIFLSPSKENSSGEIAPFKGVRNSCEKEDKILV